MPVLSTTKTYLDGNILIESDLDNLKNSWETFFNVTKLDNGNFQAGGLTGSNFAAGTIDVTKLAAGAVTSAKFATNAVTPSKRPLNYAVSTVVSSFSLAGPFPSSTQIGSTLALTCSGVRPVLLTMIPYEGGGTPPVEIDSAFTVTITGSGAHEASPYLQWNGSGVPSANISGQHQFRWDYVADTNYFPISSCTTIAFPSSGLQGFALWVNIQLGGGQTGSFATNGRLLALEL